jgi:hypothetical protein
MRLDLAFACWMLFSPVVACAGAQGPLPTEQRDAVLAAWHALTPPDVEAKKIDALPAGVSVERIDVSPRIRSASFGHTTTLLVPEGGKQFWVEYGKSTNKPGGLFGPFAVHK